MKNKLIWIAVITAAIIIVSLCSGCAVRLNNVVKIHPDGTKETDTTQVYGFEPSGGKEFNVINIAAP